MTLYMNITRFLPVLASLVLLATPLCAATSADAAVILTPKPAATPRINGPSIYGVRPGSPFLYAIPATGDRPMTFSAKGLPAGLRLDAATGRITGALTQKGEFAVTLQARNARGTAEKKFRIVVGDQIALTPPMGWSSWNCWGGAVSQEKVLNSAHAMVEKGLRDHGWTYVNIDDGWQGLRDRANLAIQPNSKFPDMKALADEVHALGLKFGIYSTPWRGTYEGHVGGSSNNADGTYDWAKAGDHNEFFRIGKDPAKQGRRKMENWTIGKYSFAEQDARQWAAWGVDYLKYDWFPNDVPHVAEMSVALRKTGRDIVYSLSNTGLYDNAADYARLANLWRTTGDIRDTWKSVSTIGFMQDRWAAFAGPGHWTDPDMLVVGLVGGWASKLHPTALTPDEQYTHISLWCLLSAPLLIGCDIAQMDDFTLGLLTNDEVLAIDQDALGRQATQISNENGKVVYAKTLEDGSTAIGLFNRGNAATAIAVTWGPWGTLPTADQGGARLVRDLWRQKDLGVHKGKFETNVPPHGVVLVRLSKAK
jgi:alpha-galactosidase